MAQIPMGPKLCRVVWAAGFRHEKQDVIRATGIHTQVQAFESVPWTQRPAPNRYTVGGNLQAMRFTPHLVTKLKWHNQDRLGRVLYKWGGLSDQGSEAYRGNRRFAPTLRKRNRLDIFHVLLK